MADWTSLPFELLVLIVELLNKFKDFFAFRSVCKSWHAAASKESFKALWLRERTPYLMLPVTGGNLRGLYSLAEGEIVTSVRVPDLYKRKCYESLGWFLAVGRDGNVCLLDPFSSAKIQLPDLNTLKGFNVDHYRNFVKKMVLSARPGDPSSFVVALIFRRAMGVAFWKPGDKSWHLTLFGRLDSMYNDITYHAGSYYVFDEVYQVICFNILNGFPKQGEVVAPCRTGEPGDLPNFIGDNVYIVHMQGSLRLVTRSFNPSNEPAKYSGRTRRLKLYEFENASNTLLRIYNLGNLALFLGSDIATTVVDTSSFLGFVKPNHIYSCDDSECNPFGDSGEPNKAVTGKDMAVYNLEFRNGKIEPVYHGKSFESILSHPTWIFPFMHTL